MLPSTSVAQDSTIGAMCSTILNSCTRLNVFHVSLPTEAKEAISNKLLEESKCNNNVCRLLFHESEFSLFYTYVLMFIVHFSQSTFLCPADVGFLYLMLFFYNTLSYTIDAKLLQSKLNFTLVLKNRGFIFEQLLWMKFLTFYSLMKHK